MKHYFITNPAAGKKNNCESLADAIRKACEDKGVCYEIYETKCVRDATAFVKQICENNSDGEELRFYACGGDGTLGEVVTGAVGFPFASVGLIPNGTGNDFVRNFTNKELFFDIGAQLNGKATAIDVLSCNDMYAINMINIGFDCEVVKKMMKIKRLPGVPSKLAYILGILPTLITKPTVKVTAYADGDEGGKKDLLLMTLANGCYCGGGFHSNPEALLTDGKINALFVNNIGRLRFIQLVSSYKKGTHLVPENASILSTVDCSSLDLVFEGIQSASVDGEIHDIDGKLHIEIIRGGLNFVVPCGSSFIKEENKIAEEAIV